MMVSPGRFAPLPPPSECHCPEGSRAELAH